MAREFDGPLSKDDLTWLNARFSTPYVDRMVSLHGMKGGKSDAKDAAKEAEAAARKEQEAADAADEAARQAAEAAAEGSSPDGPDGSESGGDGPEEDLIGDDVFDVTGSTEGEVKTWVETASDEDKAAALASEQAREDRDPRKGVVALLS